ncbi:ISL3 family transposase [Dolosigranulum pigrum]|uniref:ISL3 family transposase n=1 Tax=Dolosigranulum pigrum TaxID=29394 RepID=UPI001AD86C17|nr:ISL3 family transposase [Dolosigranulum pigrum]QTJ38286.1 ISL3 family transposase [Dolosigranulum pigrum]
MSKTNSILNLIGIQDENTKLIEKNPIKTSGPNEIIYATLTYQPQGCCKCGIKNDGSIIIKYGTKTSRITLSGLEKNRYLVLKKQRFQCKACGQTFIAQTSVVDKYCYIANQVKRKSLDLSRETICKTTNARLCPISVATVQRICNAEALKYKEYGQRLPSNIGIDEFRYRNQTMAFDYIDNDSGNILGILPNRRIKDIKNHFYNRYNLKERKKVQTVTTDLNAGYIHMIPELFPNATIILDRFHLVQLMVRALDRTRIKVMNRLKKGSNTDQKRYRRLKRYGKMLKLKSKDISFTNYKLYYLFGYFTAQMIVDKLLAYDELLKRTWEVYQCFMRTVDQRDGVAMSTLIHTNWSGISPFMHKSLRTLKKYSHLLTNAIESPYSNGLIEGTHNTIKRMTHNGCGYRNIENLSNRILIMNNLKTKSRKAAV